MVNTENQESEHQGLNKNPSPFEENQKLNKVPRQKQEWPGSDRELTPKADHGEASYKGSNKLLGCRALITGGDSGIGRAVAIAYAREGADVAIVYLSEDADAQETCRWVEKEGRKCVSIRQDISLGREACKKVVNQAVKELGGLDILVNNAAVHFEREDMEDLNEEDLELTFRTNVFAYIWLSQAALEHLEEGSAIIHTGSVTGLRGSPSLLDYAATKGAVHNLTQSMAGQLADRGIRVNCIAPGPVWTPLIASTRDPKKVEGFGHDSYWGRPAQPVEMAPAFVFMASADSRFCTGEILALTGLKESSR